MEVDGIECIKKQLELLNKEFNNAVQRHTEYINKVTALIEMRNAELKIAEEKAKESWIKNPMYLILSADGYCLPYPCEWKKHTANVWKKGYIVGSSFATSKKYKVKTSLKGKTYEWACEVRIDPVELDATIRENTHRMLSEYSIDIEED